MSRRLAPLSFLAFLAVTLVTACHRAAPPVEKPVSRLPASLPSFSTGPLTEGAGWTRRAYSKGSARIDVTLAERAPLSPSEWDEWVRASRDYPQAALSLPPNEANGFYTCSGTEPERCE